MLLTEIPTLDRVLLEHAIELGGDRIAYRNHSYRVANLCVALSGATDPERVEKIAIAAAFHDLGIWTDRTFDYLSPSMRNAGRYLAETKRSDWTAEIGAMILEHHRLRAYRPDPHSLIEPFRRADLVDVSMGVVTFGTPRGLVRQLYGQWPDAGFHKRLIQLSLRRLYTHPWSPLPMLRW